MRLVRGGQDAENTYTVEIISLLPPLLSRRPESALNSLSEPTSALCAQLTSAEAIVCVYIKTDECKMYSNGELRGKSMRHTEKMGWSIETHLMLQSGS